MVVRQVQEVVEAEVLAAGEPAGHLLSSGTLRHRLWMSRRGLQEGPSACAEDLEILRFCSSITKEGMAGANNFAAKMGASLSTLSSPSPPLSSCLSSTFYIELGSTRILIVLRHSMHSLESFADQNQISAHRQASCTSTGHRALATCCASQVDPEVQQSALSGSLS